MTPDGLRGRVESAYRLLESGAAAPGALLGGLLAEHFSLAAPFWVGAGAAALLLPLVWPVFSAGEVAAARSEAAEPAR